MGGMFWGGKTFVRPEGEWEDGRMERGEREGGKEGEGREGEEERERKRGREGNLWRE